MNKKRSVLLVVFYTTCFTSFAQVEDSFDPPQQDSVQSIFEYLIKNEITDATLKMDMKKLKKNTYNEEYQPAEFTFLKTDKTKLSFEITVKTRGNMRKKNCYFPSLKLNFPKRDLRKSGFESIDKYKLVCQCKNGKSNEQLLLKEYLAYKLYNIITDNSFRVHLLSINYIDTRKNKIKKRYGFLIESEEEIMERLDGHELAPDSVFLKKIQRDNILQMGIFQYMIGNTDYSMKHMHNLIAIQMRNTDSSILIPYDFDYSGLVNARYAVPNPEMPVRDIKERWFNIRGFNRNEIEKQIEVYQFHKEEIMGFTQKFSLLDRNSHHDSVNYIAGFFEIIENPIEVKSQFVH